VRPGFILDFNIRKMKRIYKISVLVLIFIGTFPEIYAQDKQPEIKYGIGAAAGFSTGYGLSFRYWPSVWGVQTTFAPYYDEYGATISYGLTGLRLIEDAGWVRFFGYVSQHLFINQYNDYETNERKTNITGITGIGPGLEFIIKQRLGINVMFGFGLFLDNEDMLMSNLTGEAGIYYRF